VAPTGDFEDCECEAECYAWADPWMESFESNEVFSVKGEEGSVHLMYDFPTQNVTFTMGERHFISEVRVSGELLASSEDCKLGKQAYTNTTDFENKYPMLSQFMAVSTECGYGPKGCLDNPDMAPCLHYLNVKVLKKNKYASVPEYPWNTHNFVTIEREMGATGLCIDQNDVPVKEPNWRCTCDTKPTPEPTVRPTPAPTPSGQNLTCTAYGDPHNICFKGNNFQIVPSRTSNFVKLYEIPGKITSVLELESRIEDDKHIDIATALILYDGDMEVMYKIAYNDDDKGLDCKAFSPDLLSASQHTRKGDLQFSWVASGDLPAQDLIISWECKRLEDDTKVGMTITWNKLNIDIADQLKFEEEHNSGSCVDCSPLNIFYPPSPEKTTPPTPETTSDSKVDGDDNKDKENDFDPVQGNGDNFGTRASASVFTIVAVVAARLF